MKFLSNLKNLFQTDHNKKAIIVDENPNFVTRPNRILQMLHMLQDEATQIVIVTPDGKEQPSKILKVAKEGLLIDQFSSSDAHKRLKINTLVEIKAKQKSVTFTFKAKLLAKQKTKLNGYLISIPNKVYYPQKRAFFRAPLTHLNSIALKASLESSENTLTGHVLDLSPGGLSVRIKTQLYIKRGNILSPVSVVLDKDETIICDLLVASVTQPNRSADVRVGCQFMKLDAETSRTINKFIAVSERKRAKKGQKDS